MRLSFVLLLLTSACLQNKFKATDAYNDKQIKFVVPCGDEQKGDKLLLRSKPGSYDYQLTSACPWLYEVKDEVNATKPVKIVLVIDLTASMGPSLKEIKTNLIDFSTKLQEKGWDARFAAVGFGDGTSSMQIVDFDFAGNIYPVIYSWQAKGGNDPQEAGQLALEKALDIIQQKQIAEIGEAPSDFYVLYVSDSPMYAGDDHEDFSVDNLAARYKDSHVTLLYAVNPETKPQAAGFNAPAPSAQLAELAKKSGIASKSLPFPVSMESMINSFNKVVIDFSQPVAMTCTAKTATLTAEDKKATVPASATVKDLDKMSPDQLVHFDIPIEPNVTQFNMTVVRHCCPDLKGIIACVDKTWEVPLSFSEAGAAI